MHVGSGMYEVARSGSNSRRCRSNAINLSKIHPDPRRKELEPMKETLTGIDEVLKGQRVDT